MFLFIHITYNDDSRDFKCFFLLQRSHTGVVRPAVIWGKIPPGPMDPWTLGHLYPWTHGGSVGEDLGSLASS